LRVAADRPPQRLGVTHYQAGGVSELDSVVGEPDGDQDERNPDEGVWKAGKNVHADNIAIEIRHP